MELSSDIITGLKRIANLSLISNENMDKLLTEISLYFKDPFNIHHRVGIPNTTPKVDILKESYAVLIVFLVEAIRRDIEEGELSRIISEYHIENSRKDKIINIYSKHKEGIRQSLRRFNSDPPILLSASWKMNFCTKSSFSDFDGKLLYLIEFSNTQNIENKEELKKISFVCTVQQLQTLVASLKSAVRQLESIANISK